MKLVKTFTQEDFDALVAAGMDSKQEPIRSSYTRFTVCVEFAVSDEVIKALNLANTSIKITS